MAELEHCSDLNGDRALGNYWEREFCKFAAQNGKMFTPHQIGRSKSASAYYWGDGWHALTLPDITIWTAPGEHHEVKHKAPTQSGCFGLEDYRLRALKCFSDATFQFVYYTIHNHNGNRDNTISRGEDWITAEVDVLWHATKNGLAKRARFNSWVGGNKTTVDGWFWPTYLWHPLTEMWKRKNG